MYFRVFLILMTIELVCSYPYRTINDVEYNRRYIPKLLNAKDENSILTQPQIFENDLGYDSSRQTSEKPAKYSAQQLFDQNQQYLFMNDYNKALTKEQTFGSNLIKPQAQQHFSYDMDLNRDVDERQYHGYESFTNPSQLKTDEGNHKSDQSQRQPSDLVSFRYPTRNEFYGNDDKKALNNQYLEQAQQRSFDNSPSQTQSIPEQYFRYNTQQKFTDSNSLKQQAQQQQINDMDLNRDVAERQHHGYKSFSLNPSELKLVENNHKNDQSQRQLLEESFKHTVPKEALNMNLNILQDPRQHYGSSSIHPNLVESQKQFLPQESFGFSSLDHKMDPSLVQNDQKQLNIESSGNQVQQESNQQVPHESYKYQTKMYPESSWYSAQQMIDRMKKSKINKSSQSSVKSKNNDMNVVSEQKKIDNSFSENKKKYPSISESFISPAYMQLDSLDLFDSLAQQNSNIFSSKPEKTINKIQQPQHSPVQHPSNTTQVKQQQNLVPVQQQPQHSPVQHPSNPTQVKQQQNLVLVQQQPQQSHVQHQPEHSSVQQQQNLVPVQQQPQQSHVQHQPEHSPVQQQPQHYPVQHPSYPTQGKQQQNTVPVQQQAEHSSIQQPQQSPVQQQSQQSSIHQQPEHNLVHQQPQHYPVQYPSYTTQVKQQADHASVYQYPSYSTNIQQPSQPGTVYHQPQYSSVQHPSYSTQGQKQSNHVPTHQPNSYNISAYLFFPNNAYISKA